MDAETAVRLQAGLVRHVVGLMGEHQVWRPGLVANSILANPQDHIDALVEAGVLEEVVTSSTMPPLYGVVR